MGSQLVCNATNRSQGCYTFGSNSGFNRQILNNIGRRSLGVPTSSIGLTVRVTDKHPCILNQTTASILEFLQPEKMELIWLFLNPLASRIEEIINNFLGKYGGEEVRVEFLPNAVIQDLYGDEINAGQESHVSVSRNETNNERGDFKVGYQFGIVAERESKTVLMLNGEIGLGLLRGDAESFNGKLEQILRALLVKNLPNRTGVDPSCIGLKYLVRDVTQICKSYLELAEILINHVDGKDRPISSKHHELPKEHVEVLSDVLSYYFLPESKDRPELKAICKALATEVLRNRSKRGSFGDQIEQLVSKLSVAENLELDAQDPVGYLFQSLINHINWLGEKITEFVFEKFNVELDRKQCVRLALGVAVITFILNPPVEKVQTSDSLDRWLKCFSLHYEADPVTDPGEKTRTIGLGIYILLDAYTKLEQYGLSEEILRRFGAWFVMSVCPAVYKEVVKILFNFGRHEFETCTHPRGLEQEWHAATCLASLVEETISQSYVELVEEFGKFGYKVTESSKGAFSLMFKVAKVIREFLKKNGLSLNDLTCAEALEYLRDPNSRLRLDCAPDTERCRVVIFASEAGGNVEETVASAVANLIYKSLEIYGQQVPERAFNRNPLGLQLQIPSLRAEILVMHEEGYRIDSSPTLEGVDGLVCNPWWHSFFRATGLMEVTEGDVPRVKTVLQGL